MLLVTRLLDAYGLPQVKAEVNATLGCLVKVLLAI